MIAMDHTIAGAASGETVQDAAPKDSQSQAKGQKSTKYCICGAWMMPCMTFLYFAILL